MTKRHTLTSKETLRIAGRGTVKVVGGGLDAARSIRIGDEADIDGEPWTVAGVEMPLRSSGDVGLVVRPRARPDAPSLPVEIGNVYGVRGGGSGWQAAEAGRLKVTYWHLRDASAPGPGGAFLRVTLSVAGRDAAHAFAFGEDEIRGWESLKSEPRAVLEKAVGLLKPAHVASVLEAACDAAEEAGAERGRAEAGWKLAELLELCGMRERP